MKKSLFAVTLTMIFVIAVSLSPTYAKKKLPSKVRTGKKKGHSGTYYIAPVEENLRKTPSGKRLGSLVRGTAVTVNKTKGNWAYVTIKAWIWRPSLAKSKPKQTTELLVGDVEGLFTKSRFVIKGKLNNQTRVAFGKVVLQGELFKGKKRVAYKTISLFSRKKSLGAGKTYTFSISFKRLKGFDSYSVRILSASEK